MARKTQKFPKMIYVMREGEGDEAYYDVRLPDDLNGIKDSRIVAVYNLSGTGIISVRRDFHPMRGRNKK